MRKIGEKYFGKCLICGKQGELTREHVPPKCAFNKSDFKMTNMHEVMTAKKLPWEGGKLKTTIQHGGLYKYSFCKDCNSKMGDLYVRAYKSFIQGLHSIFCKLNPKSNTAIGIEEANFKPLNIFKQIVSMFHTLNPEFFKSRKFEVGQFLLNKEDNKFCEGVYFYIYLTRNIHQAPIQVQWRGDGVIQCLSEIAHYPLGIIMSIDEKISDELCINDFLNFKYNEEVKASGGIMVRERNLMIIGDYRTKEEISENSKQKKQF